MVNLHKKFRSDIYKGMENQLFRKIDVEISHQLENFVRSQVFLFFLNQISRQVAIQVRDQIEPELKKI